jgi:hypothetical protein
MIGPFKVFDLTGETAMSRQQLGGKSWWTRLSGGPTGSRRNRRPAGLGLEMLEDRLAPATFSELGNQLALNLGLNEQAGIVSGGTSYQLSLAGGTWSGTDSGDVSGNGTSTLTVTSTGLAAFSQIDLTDSAAGASIVFADSGANVYSDDFAITLDSGPASPALTFNGSTSFTGTSSIAANVLSSVLVSTNAHLSTASGAIALTGQGTGFAGVTVVGGSITTADGNITLKGTGPNGGGGDHGIFLGTAATVTSTGSGAITLVGNGNGSGLNDNGVFIIGGSQVVSSGSGAITITGTSPSTSSFDTFGVFITGPNTLVSSVSGDVHITGTALGGSGAVNNAGVLIQSAAVVQSTDTAHITITGVGSTVGSSNNPGIAIDGIGGAASVTTVNGAITLNGTGGSGLSDGVAISNGAFVKSTGAGSITAGGSSVGSGKGVHLFGSGFVTSTGGAISLTGNAGFTDGGIDGGLQIDSGGQVTSASGAISLTGTGNGVGTNYGVYVTGGGSLVRTASGNVTITGTGGGSNGTNRGVVLESGALVDSTSTGTITLVGNGDADGNPDGNQGIVISSATVRSANGAISLAGQGGGQNSSFNYGVLVSAGQVLSTGSAPISITGVAGPNGLNFGYGVYIRNAGGLVSTSGTGNITINGTGKGSGTNNDGVLIDAGAAVIGAGAVAVTGTHGSAGSNGVVVSNGSTVTSTGSTVVITSNSPLTVTGSTVSGAVGVNLITADSAAAGDDVLILNGSSVTSSGDIAIRSGDNVTVDATSAVTSSAGQVSVGADASAADPGVGVTVSLLGTITGAETTLVFTGSDNDTIILDPVSASAAQLDADFGDDSYSVTIGHLTGLVDVDDQVGSGTDRLIINGTAAADPFTIDGGQTQAGGQTVTYTPNLENLRVNGLAGDDAFAVTPSQTAVMIIDGGSPSAPASPGDTLSVDVPAGLTWTRVNGPTLGSGTFHTSGGYQDVNYAGIETVVSPNRAPVNTVPVSVTAHESVATPITGISVFDPDAGSSSIQVTLSVQHGTLTVVNVPGGPAITIAGPSAVILTGSQAQINAALAAGLVYVPTTSYSGGDILIVSTNDQGHTGTGGPWVVTNAVTINVLSTLQQIGALIAQVQADIAAGLLTNGQGTSMISSALKKVTETTGIAQIDKFISDVQKLVQQGKLSQANADPLLLAARDIRAGLTA